MQCERMERDGDGGVQNGAKGEGICTCVCGMGIAPLAMLKR